jgi:hypothetical protein
MTVKNQLRVAWKKFLVRTGVLFINLRLHFGVRFISLLFSLSPRLKAA